MNIISRTTSTQGDEPPLRFHLSEIWALICIWHGTLREQQEEQQEKQPEAQEDEEGGKRREKEEKDDLEQNTATFTVLVSCVAQPSCSSYSSLSLQSHVVLQNGWTISLMKVWWRPRNESLDFQLNKAEQATS